jgi:hypothetical protein
MIDAQAWLAEAVKTPRTITTTVVNKHISPPADAHYIGRGSPCGNPYPIDLPHGQTRELVIQRCAEHAAATPALVAEYKKLKGKKLLCFCAPRICHGDMIAIVCEGLEADPIKAGLLVTEGGLTIAKIKAAFDAAQRSEIEY